MASTSRSVTAMGVPVVVCQVPSAVRPSRNAKAVGVEEVAAVGRNRQLVVVDAAVHGAAGG